MADYLSKNLRPASFRGVPFQVEGTDLGFGRRSEVHEYPQRDKPWVEDLGRAARELSFEAFVVGADYVAQAQTLIAALEEGGPGTLVHPWFGSMQVSAKDLGRVTFSQALGYARFSLSFVESGELAFPAVQTSTQAASRAAASQLETKAVESFAKRFKVDGFQDFVAQAAAGNLGDVLGIVSSSEASKFFGFTKSLGNSVSTAIALVGDPETLGWKVMGMLGLSDASTAVAAWVAVANSLSRVGTSNSLASPSTPQTYTPSRQQAYENERAVKALVRNGLVAQAVGACSLVGTSVDSGPNSQADIVAVRQAVTAALDDLCSDASDDDYEALQAARRAVWEDLTARSRDSARLLTRTPLETTPAIVLAYDYYEDATRAEEIVQRNRIRHPGFVPPVPLMVLSR